MRTALVLEDSSKVDLGGGQRVTLEVLDLLGDRVRFIVLDPAADSRFVRACRDRGLEVHRLAGAGQLVGGDRPYLNVGAREVLATPAALAVNLVTIARLARALRPDLAYVTTRKGLLLAALARRVLGLPFVFHAHSLGPPPGLAARLLGAALAQADHVVAVSGAVARSLGAAGALVLPNPVTVRAGVAPRTLPDRALRVASLSALLPLKGVEDLVRAERWLRDPSRVELHVLGAGPEGDRLRRLAGSRVTFHGAVDDVPERLRGALDLVVLPSVQPEACPLAALEAMAEGIPVITTALGGGAELVVDGITGVHVPPARPDAIAAAIDGYLADPDRYRAHSAAALARAQAYRRERFADRLAPVLGVTPPAAG